jgi:hypothetical protein
MSRNNPKSPEPRQVIPQLADFDLQRHGEPLLLRKDPREAAFIPVQQHDEVGFARGDDPKLVKSGKAGLDLTP